MRTLFIVMGNGFTMDLMGHIKKNDVVNVGNLFAEGYNVMWPSDDEPGFLSYKRCPHLWNLGARPSMTATDATLLIEDIITCVNMFTEINRNKKRIDPNTYNRITDNIYISAYQELSAYIKHLFIYYNNKITDDNLSETSLKDWGWYKFLKKADSLYDKIYILTYNYDVFLERIMLKAGIAFNIAGIEEDLAKYTIIKPHGSISFSHKVRLDRASFKIKTDTILQQETIDKFAVNYANMDDHYLVDAIIPPAGDSGRFNLSWAKQLREYGLDKAAKLSFSDEAVVCGLSYWHVDRKELDELLAAMNPNINIKLINPSPPRTLNAVLSCLFSNYIQYSTCRVLGE